MENNKNETAHENANSQPSPTSESNIINNQLPSNTQAQKIAQVSSKRKTPRYLQNASIKLLTHPVDKNIVWSFLISIIFAAISVLTGFPTVIVLVWFLFIALVARILIAKCSIYRRLNREHNDIERNQNQNESPQDVCITADNFARPPESLWLHDTSFNLYIAHCLFFLESGFSCAKLQELIKLRILNQTNEEGWPAFPRFIQKIVPVCSGYYWMDDNNFSLDNHIYEEKKDIKSNEELQNHLNELMCQPLPLSKPLWEIRLIKDFGKNKDTVLVIRIHQAVSDAITLILILANYLSDNQQLLKLRTRFGSATFFLNLFRALFVAPLTFLGWLLFRKRDYNFFNRRHKPQNRVVAWSNNIKFSKVLRIKQVMRCSMNDVFVSAASGAVRAYFTRHGIRNPPNVTLSIPVDLRFDRGGIPEMGCRFSQVSVRLPSNTEGAVPRLWEVRRRMEELKTSPDTLVMFGAVYCLLPILPEAVAQWILNTVIRKATVVLANVPGPEEFLTLGSKKLKKMIFWMSPRPEIPVVFSVISYAGSIQLSVSADKMVVTQPQLLIKEFVMELKRLSHLLARRRIPGEHRRRSHFTEERRLAEIINPPDGELQQKLHSVQEEIHAVTLQLNKLLGETKSCGPSEAKLLQTLDELKEEFSELMRELRRRKSLADGIVLNNQVSLLEDEDMDGELRRRPRRLTLTTPGRRASLSTMLASTTRPLATPTISHHAFVVSTPNLQTAEDFSPTTSQTKSSFLQVAQERSGRRKSDFN
ncbi:uncharacterized protein LOC129963409 isoform X1 [Argiope bruennichi]|uniref:Putative diacylglycerol O-acyltransferase like protein n=1 Tax=Argiope bruennichi TaxID=94029 RepID=A0A8T0F3I1_ARGBR|nr:uncharacterized protein LOC129963409 isoform X1 [Argiope bruennichi]KAF8783082.1 putative diacylglycerol O-acyltransferase like protein [Argiope bruennichi]